MLNGSPHAPANHAPFILTLDVGTSSVRALLYDAHGQLVPGTGTQEHYQVHTAADGTNEDNPVVALERIARCIDTTLAQAGSLAYQIGAVAVATLVSNLLAIDAHGHPLTPLITYADTRNAEDATTLQHTLDEQEVHQRTGCLLRTSYWPARLAWLRRTQLELWKQTARWLTIGEFLELQLFGVCHVSYSVAAWSGLLHRTRLVWDAELLAYLGVDHTQLSPLADFGEPLRGLRGEYAQRWPALQHVPWFPTIGDGAAANIGSGATGHTRMALTIGTTGALRVVQPRVAYVPPGLWCYRVDRRRALLGGATSEGGNVYAWLRRTLNLGTPEQIETTLAAMPPDAHGLTVLPFVAGERSPGWAGDVRATIHGLGTSTTPAEIVRACLEAIAYRFALIEQRLCDNPTCAHAIIGSGGALLSSPAWMQIIADVLNRPLIASEEYEATSRGIALLALEALGAMTSIDDLPAADGATYHPNPERHTIYMAAIARQQALYMRFYPHQTVGVV